MGLVTAGIIGAGAAAASAGAGAMAADKKSGAARDIANKAEEAGKRAEAAAAESPQEIMMIEKSMKTTEDTIAREQKLIEAVDPAIMEAGKQAFQMLQGKESEMLGPIRNQRARQKQQLTESLRSQLGPGFETSSAGIEALSKFDIQTSDMLAQTQQQAVGQLLGVAQQGASLGRQAESAAQTGMRQTLQLQGAIQTRESNAALGTMKGITDSGKNVVDTAGGAWDVAAQGFGQVAKFAGFFGGSPKTADTESPGVGTTAQQNHTGLYDHPAAGGWQEQ